MSTPREGPMTELATDVLDYGDNLDLDPPNATNAQPLALEDIWRERPAR